MRAAETATDTTNTDEMFLTTDELKSVMYGYQVAEITEGDSDIAAMAIEAAVQEMAGYLRAYDTEAIFAAEGTARSALVLELCKNIAAWYIVRLANVDIIYDHVKERYDRAIAYLKQVSEGTVAPRLPLGKSSSGEAQTKLRTGSNPKFNHHF